jgi:PGF-CTERM protein
MTRRSLLLVGLLAVAAVAYAGVAVAHANHASAGPQVSGNGSVVVEQAFLSQRGYVAVTTDPASGEGRVLGHRAVGAGLHTGLRVGVDADYWDGVAGNTTLRVRLYGDDGDGEFDPDADPVLRWLDRPAGGPFPVRPGSGAAYIVPSGDTELTAEGRLPVAAVALPARGHVVVHDGANGTLGSPLGHRTLDGGRHANVAVPVAVSGNRSVTVALHRDDGDGEFEPGADPVIRVAETPVATSLSVAAPGSDDGSEDVRVNTPTATDGPTTDSTAPPRTRSATATATTSASGPGFGLAAGLAALLGTALAAVRRRR